MLYLIFKTLTNLQKRIRIIVYVSIFSALTAVGAFIKIPLLLVPFTLQTFFVILSGNILGSRYGALSQTIYLCLGLMGLPIFAYGGGIGYIFKPTFGYLIAYPVGAFISGYLLQLICLQRKENIITKDLNYNLLIKTCFVNFISILVILIIGVIYLFININFILGKDIEFNKALWSGLIIFLPSEAIKVIIASLVTIRIKRYFHL